MTGTCEFHKRYIEKKKSLSRNTRRHGLVLFHLKCVNWAFPTAYVTTARSFGVRLCNYNLFIMLI